MIQKALQLNPAKTIDLLNDRHHLELTGMCISYEQLVELFSKRTTPSLHEKWIALFTRMSHPLFLHFLEGSSESHLTELKSIGYSEPLHHQLYSSLHLLKEQAQHYAQSMEKKKMESLKLTAGSISQREFDEVLQELSRVRSFFERGIDILDKLLSIAWPNRLTTLIEEITRLKENWLFYLREELGELDAEERRVGSFAWQFESNLESIFDRTTAEPALQDSDPAIEALSRMQLWYPEEYAKEILLLAGETQEEDKEVMNRAKEVLTKVGLQTVGDLKKKKIFSIDMLRHHIQSKFSTTGQARGSLAGSLLDRDHHRSR